MSTLVEREPPRLQQVKVSTQPTALPAARALRWWTRLESADFQRNGCALDTSSQSPRQFRRPRPAPARLATTAVSLVAVVTMTAGPVEAVGAGAVPARDGFDGHNACVVKSTKMTTREGRVIRRVPKGTIAGGDQGDMARKRIRIKVGGCGALCRERTSPSSRDRSRMERG